MRNNRIALLFVPLLLAACASTSETNSKEASVVQLAKQEAPVEVVAPNAMVGTTANIQVNQQQASPEKSVYFDFDKFDIKIEYRDLIRQQADFIKAGSASFAVEGNADERGSSEYNLALGSKRANEVAKVLGVYGINKDQISVASFGEEKPKLDCHEEKCWAENRRVDFSVKQGK